MYRLYAIDRELKRLARRVPEQRENFLQSENFRDIVRIGEEVFVAWPGALEAFQQEVKMLSQRQYAPIEAFLDALDRALDSYPEAKHAYAAATWEEGRRRGE